MDFENLQKYSNGNNHPSALCTRGKLHGMSIRF